jgi:hypothetical protein
MLVGTCSSELSGHRLHGKLKKSQPPSEAGFPATLHWTEPRVRFSVGENRMKSVNANKINRKSGEAEGPAVLSPPR